MTSEGGRAAFNRRLKSTRLGTLEFQEAPVSPVPCTYRRTVYLQVGGEIELWEVLWKGSHKPDPYRKKQVIVARG